MSLRFSSARSSLNSLCPWLLLGGVVVGGSGCGASTLDDGREHPEKPSVAIDEDGGVGGMNSGGTSTSGTGTQSPSTGSASQPGTKPTSGTATATPTSGTGTTKPGTSPTDKPPVMSPTTPGMIPPPPGKPPIIVPPTGTVTPPSEVEDCEVSRTHSDEKYCEQVVSCDNATLYASCYDNGAGGWDCSCSNGFTGLSYHVEGADKSICESSIVLCTPGQEPPLSEVTCGTDYEYAGASYCSSQRTCSRSADIGGLQAQIQDYQSSSCQDMQDGTIDCWCSTSGAQRSYEFTGSAISETCGTTLDLCATGEAPVFPEEQACKPQYRNDYGSSCEYAVLCTSSVAVSPGVTALAQESQYANCYQKTTDGPWGCSCSTGEQGLNFEIANNASGSELCPNALTICEDLDVSELTGESTCKQNSQYAGTGYCSATAQCTQDTTVNGMDLSLIGSISANCQVGVDGAWSCACYGGNSQASLEVQAADEWDACGQAIAECPNLVSGSVGGGFMGVPLPGRPIGL